MDALALPFVQGRLSGQPATGLITTQCAHSRRAMHITMDSALNFRVTEQGASPLIFAPLKVVQPGAPSIIDGF